MKNEKQVKILSVIALIISIVTLTIVYALMSSKLTINGFRNAGESKLSLYFENLTSSTTGSAVIDNYPQISNDATYIGDFEISLYAKGDSVSFCYDVINKSSVDVKLQNKLINGLDVDLEDEVVLLKSVYISADWDGDGTTSTAELLKSKENISISVDMPEELESSSRKNECTTIALTTDEIPEGNVRLKLRIDSVYVQS